MQIGRVDTNSTRIWAKKKEHKKMLYSFKTTECHMFQKCCEYSIDDHSNLEFELFLSQTSVPTCFENVGSIRL